MFKQLNMLEEIPPYQQHSNTSKQAAKDIIPHLGCLQHKVYSLIALSGARGLTDIEIETESDLKGSTIRPRRIELLNKGLIKDSGKTRKTPSGRSATVWVASGE